MLDKDITITDQFERSEYDRVTLKKTEWMRIEFRVGDFGPFTVKIPLGAYTADERDRQLNDRAAHIRVGPVPY